MYHVWHLRIQRLSKKIKEIIPEICKTITPTGVSIVVQIILVGVIIYQSILLSSQIDIQKKTYEVEYRPYLGAYLNDEKDLPKFGCEEDNIKMIHEIGHIYLKNYGRSPAIILDQEYEVISDKQKSIGALKRYNFKKGYNVTINNVYPESESKIFINPQIGIDPKKLFVWTKIRYRLASKEKVYWYVFWRELNSESIPRCLQRG